jgi:hypothetical protein
MTKKHIKILTKYLDINVKKYSLHKAESKSTNKNLWVKLSVVVQSRNPITQETVAGRSRV